MIMRLKEMKGGRWSCWEWLNLNMGWIMWMEKIQVMNLNSCWTIYIDGEDPCNESEYVLDYIYLWRRPGNESEYWLYYVD